MPHYYYQNNNQKKHNMFRGYSFYSPQILFCGYRFFFLLPLFFWVNWAELCVYPQVIRQFVSQLECSLAGGWVSEQQDAVWRDGKRCLEGGKGKVFLWRRTLESHNITFEFCLWKHRGAWFTQAEPWLLLVPNKSSLKSNSQVNPRPVKRQGDLCFSFFLYVCGFYTTGREMAEKKSVMMFTGRWAAIRRLGKSARTTSHCIRAESHLGFNFSVTAVVSLKKVNK